MPLIRLASLTRPLRPLRRFAAGGAWFFIVVSLIQVIAAAAIMWQDSRGFKLVHSIVGDRSYDAPFLTYHGTTGLLLALFQAAAVALAAAFSVLPWPRTLALRRAGHVALVGWSGLWAADLIWLASIDGRWDSIAQAILLCVLLLCTGLRAVAGWNTNAVVPIPRRAPWIEAPSAIFARLRKVLPKPRTRTTADV